MFLNERKKLAHISIYIYTCIDMCTYVYIYISLYIYISMYICICTSYRFKARPTMGVLLDVISAAAHGGGCSGRRFCWFVV